MADLTDDELMAAIGNAPIQFWMCPVRQHGDRTDASGRPVVTVEWQGDIARCTAPGCGRTSTPDPADPGHYDRDSAIVFNAITETLSARGRFAALSDRSAATAAVPSALRADGRLLPTDAETRTADGES